MDGRVKTLHPMIHGILAVRDNVDHAAAMDEHAIAIDRGGQPLPLDDHRQGGGDARRVRRADRHRRPFDGPLGRQNHKFVAIVLSRISTPTCSRPAGERWGAVRRVPAPLARLRAHCVYDAAIASWLSRVDQGRVPGALHARGRRSSICAREPTRRLPSTGPSRAPSPVPRTRVLSGKALYNNWSTSTRPPSRRSSPALRRGHQAHQPVRGRRDATIAEALENAWSGDPISAFGSVLAFTRPLDLASATFLVEGNRFVEDHRPGLRRGRLRTADASLAGARASGSCPAGVSAPTPRSSARSW